MDTAEIKTLLFETMQRPTKKRMAALAEQVIVLCDACDSKDNLSGIIEAGQVQLESSFNMLQELMKR